MDPVIPDDVLQYLLEGARGGPNVTPGGMSDVDMHQEIVNRRAAMRPPPSPAPRGAAPARSGRTGTSGLSDAPPPRSTTRVPPEQLAPGDLDAFDAATQADRDASDKAALAQNLSRAASLYRGVRDPGPVASAVPTNVRDWMLRRGLVAEDAAAKANAAAQASASAPPPDEWNAPPGLTRSEALAQGYAKAKSQKPGDQPAPKEWGAPDGMSMDQAIRAGYGRNPKDTKPADAEPSEADRAELKRRGISPDLASTHGDALHLIEMHQRSQDAKTRSDQSHGDKDDQYTEKLRDKYQKGMDAAAASSRSAFGQSANIVFRGARSMALLKQTDPATGKPRQLTGPEWQEVTAGLVAMQTGGVPTERMMQEALPKDVKGDAAGIISWLKSAPQEIDRQEWIDRFTQNIEREEKAAKDFQRKTMLDRHGAAKELMRRDPDWVRERVQQYGLDQPGVGGHIDPDTLKIVKDDAGGKKADPLGIR